jgi:replicative DNA helicase
MDAVNTDTSDERLEAAVLGACLAYPDCIVDVSDILKPDTFSKPAHREIWASVAALHVNRAPVDTMTVVMDLKRRNRLELAGGLVYISGLTTAIASTKHVQYHSALLVQMHLKRETILLGLRLQNIGNDPTSDPFDLLSSAAHDIRLLSDFSAKDPRTMDAVISEVVDEQVTDRGIQFGFDALEQKRIRLEPGTVTIIGARPAMGKTSYMLSCAWRQAVNGHRPYIAELEMKDRNLGRRLVCGECGIPAWKSKRGILSDREREAMAKWSVTNGDLLARMVVDESSSMTVSTLAAKLDRAKRKHKIDVVWVDYIGLLQPSTKQKAGYDRMTAISNELRVLAKDLDLPFAVLAQLNRPVKGQAVKPPGLTDLRDSGEIEQDAEAVMFLHRPKYYDQGADDNVDVIIAKNRDGEDGIATLLFDGQGTRMLDWPGASFAPPLPRVNSAPHPDNRTDTEAPF